MAKNTVHRVERADATRNTRMPDDVAKLTAAWKRRHDEIERGAKFIGAHDTTSTRVPSRQEVREMMSYQGGQGDPDAMLGERMNPILEAPMFAAGVPLSGAAALTTAGTVLGASYGLEKLAEENPKAAAMANLALAAAPAVPMAKAGASAFGKAVRGKLSDAIDFGPLAVSGKGEVSAMADRAAKAAALRAMRRARDAQAAVERAHSTRAVDSVMSQLGSLDDMKQAGYDPEFIELLRENGWRRGYIPQNNMPEDEAVRLMIGTQTRGKMLAEAVRKSDGELLPPSFFVTERGAKTGVPLEGWNSSFRDEVGAGHDFRVVLVPKRDVVNPAESQYVKWFVGDGQTPQIGVNGIAPYYESRVVIGDPGNPGELARGLREYQKKLSGHGTPANKANSAGVSPSTPAHFLVPELEGVDISSGFPTAYKANWNLSRKLPNYGSILGSRNPHGALLANMYDYLTGRPDVIRSIELSQMQRALKKGLVDSLAEAVVKQRRFDGWQFGNAIGSVYGYANKADRTMTHNVHSNLKRGLNLGLNSTNYKTGRSTPMWDVSLVSRAQIEAMDEIVDALAGAQTREAAVASVRRLAEGMHLADWQTEGLTRRGGQLWDLMQDTPKGEATLDRFPGQRKLSSISSSGSSSRPYDEVKAAARLYRLGDDTDMALFVMPKGWKDGGETLRPGFMEDFNATTEFLDRKGVPWHVREVLDTDDIFGKRTGEALMELHPGFQDAKGGRTVHAAQDAGDTAGTSETAVSETPVSEAPQNPGGPRIVINPTTFTNKKDALCVAFNEGFRLWMESVGFEPQSEPTDVQRKFFSDTAYADDELQLRRTILARIATFDTSVKDPTDDQLSETASFLNEILESDWCKNDWERDCVSRLANAVQAAVGAEPVEPRQEPLEPREPEPLQKRAALGAGETKDEEEKKKPVPAQQDQGGESQEGTGTTLTSGSGAEVRYNEDGTFAGQTNPDGSYSIASASGDIANYNPDGTLQGDRSRFEAAGTTAAESAIARADRLLEKLKGIKEQVDAVDKKYGISERQDPSADPEKEAFLADAPFDANGNRIGRTGAGDTPGAEQYASYEQQRAEDTGRSLGGDIPEQAAVANNGSPAQASPEKAAPAEPPAEPTQVAEDKPGKLRMNGPSIQPVRKIGDIGAKSFTDTKHMNGPSIQPARQIGDIGAKSFTDTQTMNGPSIQPVREIGDIGAESFTDTHTMNGPSIEPVRPIGTIDTADGSGGSTLRRKKKRRSRV